MARAPIGLKVRQRRKDLGQTQVALAAKLGVSPSYLNLIENGKRPIGGRLLVRLARELDVDLEALDAASDRRLIEDLSELSADPLLREAGVTPQSAGELVGRHAPWARALATLHRAYHERDRAASALADRLSQDPFLSDAVHRMLSNAAAIRSAADILNSVDDLGPEDMRRFHGILGEESRRLADVSRSIAEFFEQSQADSSATTPDEEVDYFFYERGSHFPDLEAAVETFASNLGLEGDVWTRRLVEHLETAHGIETRVADLDGVAGAAQWDEGARRLTLSRSAGEAAIRFELARRVARASLADAIEAEVAAATPVSPSDGAANPAAHPWATLSSDAAAAKARDGLAAYCAGALMMPYAPFFERAQKVRYDVESLAHPFGATFELAAQRLVSLRRPGADAPPFAFLRSDPSGFVTARFALPNLPLPRRSGACPLWAVYQAFQTPEKVQRQLVEFPSGERFLFVARAGAQADLGFDRPRHLISAMLACDAIYADQLAYADGLALGPRAAPLPVGPSCRLCVRTSCAHRQEATVASAPS